MSKDTSEAAKACKIVLLGESGVGKTSMILRYTADTFDSGTTATAGASFASKTLEFPETKQTIKFEIWDTAGQERFRALAKVFYKNASACVLVYDTTRMDTYNAMKSYWFNEVKQQTTPETIICIAGNKSDMTEFEAVPCEEAKKFAKDNNVFFQLTSAKNKNGINELFERIGKKILEPNAVDVKGMTKEELHQYNIKLKQEQIKKDNEEKAKTKKGCC